MSAITISLLTFLCVVYVGGHGIQHSGANHLSKRNIDLNKIKYLLLAEVRRRVPSVIEGKSGSVRYALSKVQINKVQFPGSDLRIKRYYPFTVEWTVKDAGIRGEMDWWLRYKTWLVQHTDKGHASFSAERMGFSVTVQLAGKKLRVRSCSSSSPSIGLTIRGRLWNWIYRLASREAENKIRKMLAGSNGLDHLDIGIPSIRILVKFGDQNK